ncbi:hypothetical protein GGR53DRAFT_507412 [Hypoxylon sp. FL1150]|nr:hypothetical protein GGR53DRAFT_507412 [Hypoxylon sp. FL1150]
MSDTLQTPGKMGLLNKRNIQRVALLSALNSVFLSSFTSASASPSESPSAENELICHTDNPAECYPKVFSATEEFQTVRDDQDLPPGLHVRLDIQTGQKQAKLYDPKEDANPALEGLPVDRSVVVVDPQDEEQPQIPLGAPAYEPVGVVKAPREKNAGFSRALETVKKDLTNSCLSDELDTALQDLEDLSHDMYYGLQIVEDPDALQALFCLLLTRRDDASAAVLLERPLTERPDFLASSILASSIRNNKPALGAVENSWDAVVSTRCGNPKDNNTGSLKTELYGNLAPTSGPVDAAEEEAEAYFARLQLAVWDGLLKSPKIKAEFMENDGMRSFLRILLRGGDLWEGRRAKVARIVADTFLDEEVGAVLGVWPTESVASDASVCEKGGADSLEEGCWEHHLEAISLDSRDADWSQPLLDMLRQRRSETTQSQKHKRDEL